MNNFTKQTIQNAEEELKKVRRSINWERIDEVRRDMLKARYSSATLLAPSIVEWGKSIKQVAAHLPDLIEKMDVDAKKVRKIADAQMKWLRQIAYLSTYETKSFDSKEPKESKGIELIATDGKYVLFLNKLTEVRDPNSIHKLMLDALLYKSDETGFISYEEIDSYLVKHGKKKLDTLFERRKRITDSYGAIHRFLGVPKIFKDKEIILTIRGKGLQLNNRMNFVD